MSLAILFSQVILSVGFTKSVFLVGIPHFPISVLVSFVSYYLNQLGLGLRVSEDRSEIIVTSMR